MAALRPDGTPNKIEPHRSRSTAVVLEHKHSVLASLRRLIPPRSLQFNEALRLAEIQASRLLQLMSIEEGPVPNEIVTEQPRIRVEWRAIPTSGVSFWDGSQWVIQLNRTEPTVRQRLTLMHEYKHIIDHGRTGALYGDNERRAEQVADYFAGCTLVPRRLLKRAWAAGIQAPSDVARHFEVSPRAAEVRMSQVGLVDSQGRHAPRTTSAPQPRNGYYYRTLSLNWPALCQQEIV